MKDYQAIWDTLQLDETIESTDVTVSLGTRPARQAALETLPELPIGKAPRGHFQFDRILGRGGMGIVHLAHQSALRREVAIKTVKEQGSALSEVALLQEARVMGMLEHPNVVPVHIIGRGADGRPMIVMKRIQGTSWLELIQKEHEDPIRFHINIALSVCQALAFAHDRGILHRDIKPENIMVGQFGEVYLMDWGLAVSIGDSIRGVPDLSTCNDIVGTPAYMPPEMTVGEASGLGIHSDIYLLGASLYHALVGDAPNEGDSLFEVMRFAYEGRPRTYPEHVPGELVEICECAMAHDSVQRYPSVDELRSKLEDYLLHRNSYELVAATRPRIVELESLISSSISDSKANEGTEDPQQPANYTHRLFGEIRSGLLSALHIWPKNRAARVLLDSVLQTMIDYELEHENVASARLLLAEMHEPSSDLEERVGVKELEMKERDAKRAKLAYDYDENIGIGRRLRLITLLAVLFGLNGVVAFWVSSQPVPAALRSISEDSEVLYSTTISTILAILVVFFVLWDRARWREHKSSRIFRISLLTLFPLGLILRTGGLAMGTTLAPALAAECLLYTAGLWIMTLAIDRRFMGCTLSFFATALILAVVPTQHFAVFAFGSAFACVSFLLNNRYQEWKIDNSLPRINA